MFTVCILPKLSHCLSVLHCTVNHASFFFFFFVHTKAKYYWLFSWNCCYGGLIFRFFFYLACFSLFCFSFNHILDSTDAYSSCSRYVVVMLFQVNGKKKEEKGGVILNKSVYNGSEARSCSVNLRPHVALIRCVCMCVCVCTCMCPRKGKEKKLRVGVFV